MNKVIQFSDLQRQCEESRVPFPYLERFPPESLLPYLKRIKILHPGQYDSVARLIVTIIDDNIETWSKYQ